MSDYLRPFGSLPTGEDKVLQKLEQFRNKPTGWHYGSGGPISREMLKSAKRVLDTLRLCGLTRCDVFAGADYEVLVTAYYRRNYVGITLEADGTASVTFERQDEDPEFIECANSREVKNIILKISKRIWHTSDSYTRTISMPVAANSTTWHLRNRQVEECRFSMPIAL